MSSRCEVVWATLSPQLSAGGFQVNPAAAETQHLLLSAANTPLSQYTLQKPSFGLACSNCNSFKHFFSQVHHTIPLRASCHHMKQQFFYLHKLKLTSLLLHLHTWPLSFLYFVIQASVTTVKGEGECHGHHQRNAVHLKQRGTAQLPWKHCQAC